MRLDRLDLVRYGRFTDASLPFGPVVGDAPDLHVVYGDNEAGKTTTLNAVLDLLFGIEAATPYRFLHQAAAMKVAGALAIDGETREVIRLPKAALVDGDERALPEGLFSQDLAGFDRASYRSMFCLDETTLAAGGESILASAGDLGQLLFSATAGLADFGAALAQLRTETETFYKAHGRKHELGDFKKVLAGLKEQRAAIDVMAAPFARLIAARGSALTLYEEAVAERGRLQVELETSRRRLGALPRLGEWRSLRRERDVLPAAPDVPDGWPDEVAALRTRAVELAARRAATADEIARLRSDIAGLPRDEVALALDPRFRRAAQLRARDATAVKDLPDRRAALRGAEVAVERILRDLGQDGCAAPQRLLLRSGVTERLRAGLESRSGLQAALHDARSEIAHAEARIERNGAAGGTASPLPDDSPALWEIRSAIAAAEVDDGEARLRLAERACRSQGDLLAQRIGALAPWRGDAEALAALEIPDRSERERAGGHLASSLVRLERDVAESERLEGEIDRLRAERDALRSDAALIDDAKAAMSRIARDDAWATHASAMDRDSAIDFENAMRGDDAIVAARFANAETLHQLQGVERSLRQLASGHAAAVRRIAATRADIAEAEARLVDRFGPCVGAQCDHPVVAFEAFLVRRDRALDVRETLRIAQADRTAAAADAAAVRGRLARALAAVGAHADEDALVATAISAGRAFLEGWSSARGLRVQSDALLGELAERRRHLHDVEARVAGWNQAWNEAVAETWLVGDVAHVRDAMAGLAELGPALERRDGLADRVTKMEADQATFATEMAEVAVALGMERDAAPADLADRIERRTAAAARAATALEGRTEDLRLAERRLASFEPEIAVLERRSAEMTARFEVATLDDLALALASSLRRSDLTMRIRSLESEVCAALATRDIDEADSVLAPYDADGLERCRVELEGRCEDQVQRTQELFAALGRARDAVEAVGGDDRAARLDEERRTVLMEIEDRTMAHLALRAGIIAAEGAIRLYRDRHRSGMMRTASDLFRTLSRGAYRGLAAQGTKDAEVLVGLPAAGGSKLSSEMSTATRIQLYLALRIAAYREFAKTRRPLPLVLDDVLETFDDDRAEASLGLLADLATTGQVVYLTHHRHLCAIAERVCPDARFHDLGALA